MSNTSLGISTYSILFFITIFLHANVKADVVEIDMSAEQDIENCPDDKPDQSEPDKPFFSFLDKTQDKVSTGIESLARNMDDFFSEDVEFLGSTGSYLKLRQNVIIREGGEIEFVTGISSKLHLPNTEKKFKLFFETTADKELDETSTQVDNTPTTVKEADFVLGIQGDSGERYGWKYKPTLGLKLDSAADLFARFKLSREYESMKWSANWHETLYWYNSLGWGLDSYFELNKKISEGDLFRSSTFAGWQDNTDMFDLSHVFSMFHDLNNKKTISYYAGVYGISEPIIHTTHFLLGLNYRQNIHKDYLFIGIEPQIRYEKIDNFRPQHSIIFWLEVIFKK